MPQPPSNSDHDLLKQFAATRCDQSFTLLVERHLPMAHSVATRLVNNSADARDIAQDVFSRLARIDGKIPADVPLPVWLYRYTCSTASSFVRGEKRRRKRHETAAELLTMNDESTWRELEPEIDSLINQLPSTARSAIILRYFNGDSNAEIGARLGLSEEAARKKITRALETLRSRMTKRGITTTSALLASALTSNAVVAPPATLAVAISTTALAAPPVAATIATLTSTIAMTSATKTCLITAAAVVLTSVSTYLVTSQIYRDRLTHHQSLVGNAPTPDPTSSSAAPTTSNQLSTVESLRNTLSAWPTRRDSALAWEKTQTMSFGELQGLLLEILSDKSAGQRDRDLSGMFFEQMLHLDPDAAIELYATLDPQQRAAFPFNTFISTLATIDFDAAETFVAGLKSGQRRWAQRILIGGLSASDPAGAINYLESLAPADLAGAMGNLEALGNVSSHAPASIAKLLDRIPITNEADPIYSMLAKKWATEDPDSAIAWANGLAFEGVKSDTLAALYSSWATVDRDAAMTALQGAENDPYRVHVFAALVSAVIRNDPQNAPAWARSLEGADRSHALGKAGAAIASTDPRLAAELLVEAASNSDQSLALPSQQIGYSFGEIDPASAGEWPPTLPTTNGVQQHAVEGVARAWISRDPVAASEWISSLPPGEARDGAIYHLVNGIRRADPSAAFTWASNVTSDDEKRLYLLKRATDAWTEFAPDDTKAAIEKLEIPPAEKDILKRRLMY